MYRELGHDRTSIAKFLRVTPRTLFNWETGRSPVPFSTLKLLRLLVRSELPGKDWAGWCFNRGTLWSPEGHGFKGTDFAWLSMTLRRAHMFGQLVDKRRELELRLAAAEGALRPAVEAAGQALAAILAGDRAPQAHGHRTGVPGALSASDHGGPVRDQKGALLVTRSFFPDFWTETVGGAA